MSLLTQPKPEEDLYFAFKVFFDIMETERLKRRKRREKFPVQLAWYEEEENE